MKNRFFFRFSCPFEGKWLPLQRFLNIINKRKDEKVTFNGMHGSRDDGICPGSGSEIC
jgi:hypothetical protein